MDEKQYRQAVADMKSRHRQERRQLDFDFASEHCGVRVGETISNKNSTIVAEVMRLEYDLANGSLPSLLFGGTKLNKNGLPNKLGSKVWVRQSDIGK